MPTRVALVIVTYNSAKVLRECLDSLAAAARGVELAAVVVADNDSADDSTAVAESVTGLPVITVGLGRNAGYAAAVNAGVAALDLDRLDAVYVLNPDCRLRPGSIAPLAEALAAPGRGIAVPHLVNPDGSLQPSLRRMPTIGRAVAEAVLGGTLAGRLWRLGELVTDPRVYLRAGAFAWATGAAMLISVPAWRQVGRWDESFFLYSEETEFCLRARDLGWTTWYEPSSVIEHIGGESGTDPALAALLAVNRARLFRRRRGRLPGAVYHAVLLFGQGVRALAGRPVARACFAALLRPSRVSRA
ncbi:glycosyltransferase family 2 protein [Nonomuraea sp. NN258]|uniref:glycosyltransferase family 2 protein n=1 Tax=Nonomuraea antri TaxID=2730852 RepID=UPI00156A0ECD|nr:glycosyltransferase family 2 protein [Nonomuraea antri]NRQ32512.1 glycosyltransferase family 2 protein [Nonomuraea antri]